MSKTKIVGGVRAVTKLYNRGIAMVLEQKEQTQAEAAAELGISLTTFQKILRFGGAPNLQTERGRVLAAKIELWSGVRIEVFFQRIFYTQQFLGAPKTYQTNRSFRQLMASKESQHLMIDLHASEPAKPDTKTKLGRKKRR